MVVVVVGLASTCCIGGQEEAGGAGCRQAGRQSRRNPVAARPARCLLLAPARRDTKDTPRRGARFLGHKIKVDKNKQTAQRFGTRDSSGKTHH